jgi:Fur family ferric uptake transcriptional regulator
MHRETKQRQAIREVFARHSAPLSIGQIHLQGRKFLPSLSLATVYRAVRELVEEKQLTVVELPGRPPHYERAGKHHHHHFVCRRCERVFELEGCLDGWESLTPPGFSVEEHEIILYGRCQECSMVA